MPDVFAHIASEKLNDARRFDALFRDVTGWAPRLWGSKLGYGSYHYENASGRSGDWMLTGYSPRKQAMTVYIMTGFEPFQNLMKKLGKYKTGKSCLYIKRLADVDEAVLEDLITASVALMRKRYETG